MPSSRNSALRGSPASTSTSRPRSQQTRDTVQCVAVRGNRSVLVSRVETSENITWRAATFQREDEIMQTFDFWDTLCARRFMRDEVYWRTREGKKDPKGFEFANVIPIEENCAKV